MNDRHAGLHILAFIAFSIGAVSFGLKADELPGMSLSATRLMYPAQAGRGISVTYKNNTGKTWLLQSWVRKADETTGEPAKEPAPFMVIPPLVKVLPGETRVLRVLYTGSGLPRKHESVFFLSVKSVPSSRQKSVLHEAGIIPVMINSVRLYYRPVELPADALDGAAAKLTFSGDEKSLKVSNPSPYYIALASLSVGKSALPTSELRPLIPPYGEHTFSGSFPPAVASVTWRIYRENGTATKPHSETIKPDLILKSNKTS